MPPDFIAVEVKQTTLILTIQLKANIYVYFTVTPKNLVIVMGLQSLTQIDPAEFSFSYTKIWPI